MPRTFSILTAGTALAALFVVVTCSRHDFTDVLSVQPAPGGRVQAAYVLENYGPMTGTTYGITLSATGTDPRDGEAVLTEGEDDRDLTYGWRDPTTLVIGLPCGWWGNLTNHYQLPGTDLIIDLMYDPPRGCGARQTTQSSALPAHPSQPRP